MSDTNIDPALFEKLSKRLGKSKSRIYAMIDAASREQRLPRRRAALYLAAESGVNISRFASPEDWLALQRSNQPSATAAPSVTRPSRTLAKQSAGRPRAAKASARGRKIWVVQGRNIKINRSVERFLRSVHLDPMEFLKAAKRPSAHIGDILDGAFKQAAAVVVLLTPDDLAKLNPKFLTAEDGEHERRLTPQARPNVLFEAGMAFGANPNNVVIVEVGKLRPFTDISGRHVVKLNNTAQRRKELIQKLRLAGCDPDDSGSAWLDEGDFSL